MKINSQWQASQTEHSLSDLANALGFNVWKIGYKAIKNMQDARLYFSSRFQGLLVIAEFMIFQIQIADRLVFKRMSFDERKLFIQSLADKCLNILIDNYADFAGDVFMQQSQYQNNLVEIFNQRLSSYADFSFDTRSGPGYQFYRFLGEKICAIMGDDQNNKWTIDQVMDIEAPEAYQSFQKSFNMLYG